MGASGAYPTQVSAGKASGKQSIGRKRTLDDSNGGDERTSHDCETRVGVLLAPIVTKEPIALDALRGRTLSVDGNGELYQFLALIRLRDGTPLRDSTGRITSHLSGLFYRTTRLIAEHGVA